MRADVGRACATRTNARDMSVHKSSAWRARLSAMRSIVDSVAKRKASVDKKQARIDKAVDDDIREWSMCLLDPLMSADALDIALQRAVDAKDASIAVLRYDAGQDHVIIMGRRYERDSAVGAMFDCLLQTAVVDGVLYERLWKYVCTRLPSDVVLTNDIDADLDYKLVLPK
jgi:hypothetical protein